MIMDLSRSPRSVVPRYNWYDHVPQDYKYPWIKLFLPQTEIDREAQSRATGMKDRGNESFKNEDYYDALWKYQHACRLCSEYSSLKTDTAVLHSNIAAACLKLGDAERMDLLDPRQYPPLCCHPIHVLWYAFAKHHASEAIKLGRKLEPKLKQKAFYRRGLSLRKMTNILGVQNTIQTMGRIMPRFFPPQISNPYHLFVEDFVHCFKLQENSDPTFLCDALILAVNHRCTNLLPILEDKHIDSGFTSNLLFAVISHDESTRFHIDHLLFKIKVDSKRAPNLFYNASKVTPSQLLKKGIEEFKIFKLLIDYGMPVMAEDMVHAVHMLPDSKHTTINLFVSNFKDLGLPAYEKASEAALKHNKKHFIAILSEVCFHLLNKEVDTYFQQDLHSNALDKCIQSLGYTSKYNNKEHKVVALTKCIKTCFKLQKYSDAYTYCTKLVTLDRQSSEGYFYRAKALKEILSSPLDGQPPGTYKDVVSDFVECHTLRSKLADHEAYFNAVTIAHRHEITELIPCIVESDVQCGLSTQLLKEIVRMQDMSEALLKYVVFELPQSGLKKPYDARRVNLIRVLSKSSDYQLIDRLIMLGMSLRQKQMETIILLIPPEDTPAFELLLKCATKNKFSKVVLTAACIKAMDALKLEFIPLLINCGATPPTNRLQIIMGSFDNSIVQQYLDKHTIVESDAQKLYSETSDIVQRDDIGSHPIKKSRVERLNSEAKHCFEDYGDHVKALELYFTALGICDRQNLAEDAASIHSKCAGLLLQTRSYYLAYRHADACIKVKPSHEVYIVRAEALKKMLQSGRYDIPATLTYEQVIVDYLRAHELIADAKVIMEAILVAIDHGHEHLVHNREFPPDFCLTMLMEAMSTPECKEVHLEFFVNKVWNDVELSISKVTLENLIKDKAITSTTLLQWFLDRDLPLSKEDVKMAMTTLTVEQIELFKLIVAKCKHTDLDELCTMAVSVNCTTVTFVISLIEQGASLPCPSSELLLQALKVQDYDGALALVEMFKAKGTIGTLNLASLMNSNIVNCPDLIKVLIRSGVDPNEIGGKTPIAVVMGRNLTPSKTIDMLCLLLDSGEDCNHLCQTSKTNTTPLHVATELALKSGDLRVINSVTRSQTFTQNHMANDKGESPLHLAVKYHWKKGHSTTVLSALLKMKLLNPSKRDHSRKRPIDYLNVSDDRAFMLKAASHTFPSSSKQIKKKQKKHKIKHTTTDTNSSNENQKGTDEIESSSSINSHSECANQDEVKQPMQYMDLNIPKKVEFHIKRLMAEGAQYFIVEVSDEIASSANNVKSFSVANEEAPRKVDIEPPSTDKTRIKNCEAISAAEGDTILQNSEVRKSTDIVAEENLQSSEDVSAILAEYIGGLDQLSWEVEGTANVVKFFKDKKISSKIRGGAAKKIYQLAEGKRNEHLSKRVSKEKSLQLYEARITQAARILWEKAITYSAKMTGSSSIPVYSEVIRVWEIVLDHDNLKRRINYCTQQIEKSHLHGVKASVKFSLLPQTISDSKEEDEKVRGKETLDYPMQFTLSTVKETNSKCSFIPAANTRENEYNVTTFYSFDTINFKSMLIGTNERRDFPFKEWHEEHEIIKLTSNEAILLLGRSGTGKTTCCLYRLWNEFKDFWNPESNTFKWKIPRRRLIPLSVLILSAEDTECKEEQVEPEESESSAEDKPTEATKDAAFVPESKVQKSVKSEDVMENSLDECGAMSIASVTPTSASQESASSPNVDVFQVGENMEIIEENLHQVFITKNYVLRDQMKKCFYNMVAAFDFLEQHLKHEVRDPGNDLTKADDYAFPLFFTSRQFYILLDNSLCDGKAFFKRDEEGNLKIKIASLDYDNEDPDILLDLEQSDIKDEEIKGSSSTTMQSSKGHTEQWTEVTALYFKEYIWPTISHQCGISSKDFDPLLVWIEIQSFIKGSESALRKGAYLSLHEYKQIGNRMAPNFSDHRDTIYKVFLKYQMYQQNQRHHKYLFDECDLVLNLYNRLKDVSGVPWSIHSLYIDEVQDFTQAELAIFIHCCRNPNSMFFTGDTAQSIMRGVAFRFQDLRSSFHRIHSKIPKVNVPQKPYSLTINFRSHSGILNVAGSIIDLISEFFKDSIDNLPDDEGMFSGPTPVLIESCEIDDLALLLSSNKREVSAIEFGAHQVILVQSKEARENLPTILKGAIVLTIFEAKGLEFDDVLLYNFFTDSMVDEKTWRVVSSYLEMSQHQGKITNPTKLPGASDDPRSHQFDPKLHKSLDSELKYLYTAVTRAKCNLWIYDSDPKSRLPMFDYWHKCNLVKVVQMKDRLSSASKEGQNKYALEFALKSTPEQWKAQGDNFKKKHLWKQAILCYESAGPENKYLVKEAHAYHLIQLARHQQPRLYLKASLSFLECDELHHNLHYINAAAICLKNSKPHKYHEAASLFERLNKFEKAAQCYLRGKDIDNYARLKESVGQHGEVVRTLMGKSFMRKRDALAKASEYEKQGIKLHQDLSTSELSYSCAKFYSQRGDKDTLIEVLAFMPDASKKVKFLKEAKGYGKAFETLVENKELRSAYRLASAQNSEVWLWEGLRIAEENKDEAMRASFIFQIAKVEYKKLQAKNQQDNLNPNVVENLHILLLNKDKLIKAQAYLLLGMLKREVSHCRIAWLIYQSENHKVGTLEAFKQVLKLSSESDHSKLPIINMCHVAKEAGSTLMRARDINKVVKEAVSFYGLQKVSSYYYTPPGQDIWIGEPLAKCVCKINRTDLDGMLRLEASDARDELAKHCKDLKSQWLLQFDLQRKLEPKMMLFPLHNQLREHHSLLRGYSMKEVSTEALYKYLQTCLSLLELRILEEESVYELIDQLVSIFTPRVYFYLPQRMENRHITMFHESIHCQMSFRLYVKDCILTDKSADSNPFPSRVKIDPWLAAWRASCVIDPSMKSLQEQLLQLESRVNVDGSTQGYNCPPGFIKWDKDKKIFHIFSLWLKSCMEMRENGNFLWASKLAINQFLGHIAQHANECSLQVMNAVDILSIHCTGLLAVLAHINTLQQRPRSYTLPLFYKSNVYLFSLMNSRKKEDRYLLSACVDEVNRSTDLKKLFGQSRRLLIRALEIILGTDKNAPHYSVLNIGLKNIPSNNATKQCLILALVLFGNLSMFNIHEKREFFQKLQFLLQRFIQLNKENIPQYISAVYEATNRANFSNPIEVFKLVRLLLQDAQVDSTLAQFMFKKSGRHSKIMIIPIRYQQMHAQILQSSTMQTFVSSASQSATSDDMATVTTVDQNNGTDELTSIEPTSTREISNTTSQNDQIESMSESITLEAQQSIGSLHDEDEAELVISPGEYEAGFKFDVSEDTEEEQTQLELEDEQDEDMSIAITSGNYDLLSQINPDLIDPEMINPNYCDACGVSLKSDYHSESNKADPELGDEVATKEVYHIHATSEAHSSNILLYRKLAVNKELYTSLRHSLTSLLQDYKGYLQDTNELDRPVDDIQEELEKSDELLAELEEKCSWRNAIDEVSRMHNLVDRFMKRYGERLSQVIENSKQPRYRAMDNVEDNVDDVENIIIDQLELSEMYDPAVKTKKTKKKALLEHRIA